MIVQALIDANRHVTAEEIHDDVRKTYPVIDLATVYRTLQLLKRLQLVTEIDRAYGSAEYEFAGDGRHHHMVCRECRNTFDFSVGYLESLRETLTGEFGFLPDLHSFTVAGICAGCSDNTERATTTAPAAARAG